MKYFILWAFVALLSAVSCSPSSDSKTATDNPTPPEELGPKIFRLVDKQESGIDFENNLTETQEYNYFKFQYTYNGAGVAIGDINNDGLDDIYLVGNQVQDRLYLNEGGLRFKDITTSAGITNRGGFNFGVTMVDINQDGFQDFYVCRSGHGGLDQEKANLLFVNNGDLTFTESAKAYGLNDAGHSIQSAFFDYDNDGDLDVYFTNHPVDYGQNLKERLEKMKNPDEVEMDKLYRNNGNLTFTDVTRKANLTNYGHGLGLVILDINEDGWDDIYVANDYQSADWVYVNNQDGTFTDKMPEYFAHIPYYGMGVDAADINNDGLLDINVVEMLPENYKRQLLNLSSLTEKNYYIFNDVGFHHQYTRNSLSLNTGQGFFSDIAPMTGTSASDWSWATLIADFDNDGLQDILVTNGYLRDMQDKDYIKKAKIIKGQGTAMTKTAFDSICVSTKIRNYFYQNKGNLQFTNTAKASGLEERSFSNGAAYSDLDNDGDLDLVINNVNLQLEPDPAYLYENLSSNEKNFLSVSLEGPVGNKDGEGCQVILEWEDEQMMRESRRTRGFESAVSNQLHFGLGERATIDKVSIIWPDGKLEVKRNIQAGTRLVADYQEAEEQHLVEDPEVYFAHVSPKGLNFQHDDKVLNEYDLERQLPFRLGMQGPGACIGDVNGDNLDDIFFTSAHNHNDRLFLQTSNGFKEASGPWETFAAEEHVIAEFADIDNDGDLDLFVGAGGIERGVTHIELLDKLFINDGNGQFTYEEDRLPRMMSSTSTICFADVDGDQDLDAFIGSRSIPYSYGDSPKSYFLINENGYFKSMANEIVPDLKELGMVSDATWFDADNDGDQDLLVVGEWSSPSLFTNQNGKLSLDGSQIPNLKGFWRSVKTADLNGDGVQEIILGNSGTNIKYNASPEAPLRMYTGDLDNDKKRDIMIAFKQGKYYHPDRSMVYLQKQFPFIKLKYSYFADIAGKSLEQIFGKALDKATLHEINELHSLVLTKKNNIYVEQNLPTMSQVSYVNDIVSADFDQDGDMDLLVAGNELFTPIQTGSSDAGIGCLLLNDGDGNFSAVEGRESGLRLTEWVKGMELMNIKGKSTLCAWRNDEAPLFYELKR